MTWTVGQKVKVVANRLGSDQYIGLIGTIITYPYNGDLARVEIMADEEHIVDGRVIAKTGRPFFFHADDIVAFSSIKGELIVCFKGGSPDEISRWIENSKKKGAVYRGEYQNGRHIEHEFTVETDSPFLENLFSAPNVKYFKWSLMEIQA